MVVTQNDLVTKKMPSGTYDNLISMSFELELSHRVGLSGSQQVVGIDSPVVVPQFYGHAGG